MVNGYRFLAPEYAALINTNVCEAFAMRCEGRSDIKQHNVVVTGTTSGATAIDATVLDVTTSSQNCDAKMFVAAYAELLTPVTPAYAARFMAETTFTVDIDGELVIDGSAIELHLLCPACLVASQPTTATTVILGSPEPAVLGMCQMFFLPDGTHITAQANNIPTGAGDLDLNVGLILVNYTTKPRQGCLYGVGALDAQQQVYPVTYPCPASFGAAGTPSTSTIATSPTAGPTMGPANG